MGKKIEKQDPMKFVLFINLFAYAANDLSRTFLVEIESEKEFGKDYVSNPIEISDADYKEAYKDIAAKGSVKNVPEIIKKPDGQDIIQSKEYKEAYPDISTGIERKQDEVGQDFVESEDNSDEGYREAYPTQHTKEKMPDGEMSN